MGINFTTTVGIFIAHLLGGGYEKCLLLFDCDGHGTISYTSWMRVTMLLTMCCHKNCSCLSNAFYKSRKHTIAERDCTQMCCRAAGKWFGLVKYPLHHVDNSWYSMEGRAIIAHCWQHSRSVKAVFQCWLSILKIRSDLAKILVR